MSDPRIRNMIGLAVDDNPADMKSEFSDVILDKIRDVIDNRKAEIAASFMANTDIDDLEYEDDFDLEDLDDVELEDLDSSDLDTPEEE